MFRTEDAAATRLDRDGYAIVPALLDRAAVDGLLAALSENSAAGSLRVRNAGVYAVRNLLSVPAVRALATSHAVRVAVEPVVGPGARAVRGILFDKTSGANWKVAWHQDLSIAVKAKADAPGYGPWSVKAGVQHVQPPVEVLRRMLTVRVHLDDCGPDNAPLNVLPGSHAAGALTPAQVEAWRATRGPVACCVDAGGAVLMRPLLLHASSSATRPGHRRVVHLEFAAGDLPGGLEWHEDGPLPDLS